MAIISRKFLKNLLLFLGSIILSAILAEVVLRIVLPTPIVWKYPQERYIHDPEIGHWLKPGQHAFTHDKTVVTNSVGIRDSDYPERPPANVYRILAIGDSQTFGNGLDLDDTWPKQLESFLNRFTIDQHVEVLNCGLPGSDTWQHAIILQRMLDTYHPDAVVLAFYVNDVVRRFTPSEKRKKHGNPITTRVIYILKQSALLLALRTAVDKIKYSLNPSTTILREQALLSGDYYPGVEEGWKQVELSLTAMKKISDQHNIAFIIVALPRRDQVNANNPFTAYDRRLQGMATRQGIPLLDMLDDLRKYHMTHDGALFIPWDGHNSGIANRIIAQKISSWFSGNTGTGTGIDTTGTVNLKNMAPAM